MTAYFELFSPAVGRYVRPCYNVQSRGDHSLVTYFRQNHWVYVTILISSRVLTKCNAACRSAV